MDKLKNYLDDAVKLMVDHLNYSDSEARAYIKKELTKEKKELDKSDKYEPRTISSIIRNAPLKRTKGAGLAKPYDFAPMPGYQTPEQDKKNKYHL